MQDLSPATGACARPENGRQANHLPSLEMASLVTSVRWFEGQEPIAYPRLLVGTPAGEGRSTACWMSACAVPSKRNLASIPHLLCLRCKGHRPVFIGQFSVTHSIVAACNACLISPLTRVVL